MTNADEIRKMTDEELATLFTKVMAGNSGAQLDSIWQEKGMEENQRYFTRLNWLDWLKQEPVGHDRTEGAVPWSFLEEFAAGKRHNFDSDFVFEAKRAWEESR